MNNKIVINCNKRFEELVSNQLNNMCQSNTTNHNSEKPFVFEVASVAAIGTTALVAGDTNLVETPKSNNKVDDLVAHSYRIAKPTNEIIDNLDILRTTINNEKDNDDTRRCNTRRRLFK